MVSVKKYFPEVAAFLGIISLFFATRLYNILSLPIFTDEAIYVRWSQIAKQDASWRFISLTDGKQPLFVWLSMIAMRFFQDPLLAGRIVSVFAGLLALTGLFFLTSEVFKNKKIGLLACFLYVLYPFSLVYDRMALYDSLVAAFAVWTLFFEILLMRHKRLDLALILGVAIGGAILTKSSAFFFIYLLPFSLILFDFKEKMRYQKLAKWITLAVIASVFAYSYYLILRLSPFYNFISEKNALFVYPISEWIKHPLEFFINNFRALLDWVTRYVTIPLLLLAPLSFILNKKYTREKLLLFAWFIVPLMVLAFFGKLIYPRFILFMTMPLIVLIAFSLYFVMDRLKSNIFKIGVFILFVFLALRADFYILTNFTKSSIPVEDVGQFSTGWTSGKGVREAVKFFKEQSLNQKIYVTTQGTFGLMPYSLEIYLVENKNIILKGFWPVSENPPKEIIEASKKMPTYVIFYQPCVLCRLNGLPVTWPKMQTIASFERGPENVPFAVYKFNP